MDEYLVEHAAKRLKDRETYLDAKSGARVSNTLAGSIMAIQFQAPRWATEAAVKEALRRRARGARA
jgi:hypothetical protein